MPRTRASHSDIFALLGETLMCSSFLTKRLYEAEKKLGVDLNCPICMDNCHCDKCTTYLQCGHGPFHVTCVLKLTTPLCPICRE